MDAWDTLVFVGLFFCLSVPPKISWFAVDPEEDLSILKRLNLIGKPELAQISWCECREAIYSPVRMPPRQPQLGANASPLIAYTHWISPALSLNWPARRPPGVVPSPPLG